ncbi:MAG TPA: GNAT family protein [Burkholderiaceae bacterium]|nr:GNAT family protein [Burkholderiaceae bacterium]
MKTVVYGHNYRFVYWAEDVIGLEFRSDAESIGLEDGEGNILAATVFDNFSACDVSMHIASNGSRAWLNREFIVRCFAYPFLQCKARRVTALVASRNERSLKFTQAFGFVVEGRLKDALPDDDIILFGMTRDVGLGVIRKYSKGALHGR